VTPPPAPSSVRRLLLVVAVLTVASCSNGSDAAEPGGAASARGVVDAHVAASKRYDLAAACELLSPARREEMAAFDGEKAEGYCTAATEEITSSATPETKARTRGIYTEAKVVRVDRPKGTWYRIEAADGSYFEDVEVTEIDGRWWIAQIESDVDQ